MIYKNKARYAIFFIFKNYAKKIWANHERKATQERALSEFKEYIMPARFYDAEIPGLSSTISYIELTSKTPEQTVYNYI